MKFLRFCVRGLILFLTAIWGIVFGLIQPAFALSDELTPNDARPGFVVWLVMSAVGLVIPCFLAMFEQRITARIALSCSIAGNVLIFAAIVCFFRTQYGLSLSPYLCPQLLMTVLLAAYAFLLGKTKWRLSDTAATTAAHATRNKKERK